jgi:hypothetical protein
MNIRTLVVLSIGALSLLSAAESLAVTPCCAIVEIAASGVVTARETATGRTFEFQVADRRLLATLKTGQAVHADFTKLQVSVQPDGVTPCCAIVSTPAGPTTSPAGRSTGVTPCCAVVANPALRRLGRVVVAYPEEVSARIDVFRPGETQAVAGGYGDAAFDLFPGTYDVAISGKRVAGVTVRSGHDTQIKVGVLRVTASESTRVDLVDADKKTFTSGYGSEMFGLPIGEVAVQIAGQAETVAIETGQVIEF